MGGAGGSTDFSGSSEIAVIGDSRVFSVDFPSPHTQDVDFVCEFTGFSDAGSIV